MAPHVSSFGHTGVLSRAFAAVVLVAFALAVIASSAVSAEEPRATVVEGRARIVRDDVDRARVAALRDAYEKAVLEVASVHVTSRVSVTDHVRVRSSREMVLSGSVQSHSVLDERIDGDSLVLTVEALVEPRPIRDAGPAAFRSFTEMMLGHPKCGLSVSHDDEAARADLRTRIAAQLDSAGFRVVEAADDVLASGLTSGLSDFYFDFKVLAADSVEVHGEDDGLMSGLAGCDCSVSAEVWLRPCSEILASDAASTRSVAVSQLGARDKCLRGLSSTVIGDVLRGLPDALGKTVVSMGVTLEGVSYAYTDTLAAAMAATTPFEQVGIADWADSTGHLTIKVDPLRWTAADVASEVLRIDGSLRVEDVRLLSASFSR